MGRGVSTLVQTCRAVRWALLLVLGATLASAAQTETKLCVFCEIVAGRAPGAIFWREGDIVAFLSHSPINPGHLLIIPAQHAENFLEVPPETLAHMTNFAQRVARAIRTTDLKCEGVQLLMNTGKAAGQSVFHAHLHVIPRNAGDDATPGRPRPILTPAELQPVADKIRAALEKH